MRNRNLIILLLLATMALVAALLAARAYGAARYHRQAAEDVLAQYVQLAAKEMVRRTTEYLGYRGFANAWRPFYQVSWPEVPEPAGEEGQPRETWLVQTYFRAESTTGWTETRGVHSADQIRERYLSTLTELPYTDGMPFAVAFAGEQEPVIYRRMQDPDGRIRLEGMVTTRAILHTWIGQGLEQGPLLPVVRDGVAVANRFLAVRVGPQDGPPWYQQTVEQAEISATTRFPGGYEALSVTVAIPKAVAPALIIGGLPGSQLPLLLGLFLFTLSLMAVAFVQFRREHLLSLRQADSMAAISHELRTPLAQIRMFTETLVLGRVRSEEEQSRSLHIIEEEAKRLSDLVENVILFSSSLHNQGKASLGPVTIRTLLLETARFFEPQIQAKDMQVDIEAEEEVTAWADPRLLHRMLHNLLDNAIKYGPAGQTISLRANATDEAVCIEVEDQGKGIPRSESKRIWQRFSRLKRHRDGATTGHGIGLWLVARLARAQGASAAVDRGKEGGARFVLTFPPPPQTREALP